MKKITILFITMVMICAMSMPVFAGYREDAESYEENGNYWLEKEDYHSAGTMFEWAADAYCNVPDYNKAIELYDNALAAYEKSEKDETLSIEYCNKNKNDCLGRISSAGTILSGGNLTILVGIAAALVFGLLGFFVGRKSRAQ